MLWLTLWNVDRVSRARDRCGFSSTSCTIITSYGHIVTMAAVVYAPSAVNAATQISTA